MDSDEVYQISYPEVGFIDSWIVPAIIGQRYNEQYLKIFNQVLKFQFHTGISQWNNLTLELNDTGFIDTEGKEIKTTEDLQIYLQEYSRGFIDGYNTFVVNIEKDTSIFKNPDTIAAKIYLQATLPGDVRFPIGCLNADDVYKHNVLAPLTNWFNQGIKEGINYKAWYTILMEPVNFLPLFIREASFQYKEFKKDCLQLYKANGIDKVKNNINKENKTELNSIESNLILFQKIDLEDAVKWMAHLTQEERNKIDNEPADFISEGNLYTLLKDDYYNSNVLPFSFRTLSKVYLKYFMPKLYPQLQEGGIAIVPVIKKLDMKVIALIYVYNNINKSSGITEENGDGIAAEYGWVAKTSGLKLSRLASYYSININRTGAPDVLTKVTIGNKIKLFKTVLEYLSVSAKARAEDEIKILESIAKKEDFRN